MNDGVVIKKRLNLIGNQLISDNGIIKKVIKHNHNEENIKPSNREYINKNESS